MHLEIVQSRKDERTSGSTAETHFEVLIVRPETIVGGKQDRIEKTLDTDLLQSNFGKTIIYGLTSGLNNPVTNIKAAHSYWTYSYNLT